MRYDKLENAINIAILASGEGTNAENIIQYFESYVDANISCVISDREANVTKRLRRYKVPTYTTKWYKEIDKILTEHNVHYIVLAGFLDKIPPKFCEKYKWKMINIHPALLPKYGGKGMYGDKVHQLVKNNGDKKTGITVHFVDAEYDRGLTVFQKEIRVREEDSWQDIKRNVQEIEYKFYPAVIEKFIRGTYEHLYKKKDEDE